MERKIWTKPVKALPWYLLGLAIMAAVAWGFALAYDRLLAGFGAWGLITFAVLLALTEGEALEGVGEFFADLLSDLLPGGKRKL